MPINTAPPQTAVLADMIHFAASSCHFLPGLPETPAVLRGYLADNEGLALMLLASHGPGRGAIVEIGSFLGKSTCWLALGAMRAGREKVTAIDPFKPLSFMAQSTDPQDQAIHQEGSTFPFFQHNIRRFGVQDAVSPCVATSVEAAAQWSGEPIRLLFIDGCHYYEAVRQDFLAWSPFVQSGGIVVFHDYLPKWEGVIRFYDEYIVGNPDYTELFQCHSMKVTLRR